MRFSRRLLLAFLLLTPVAVPAAEPWPAAARLDAYFDALQKNQLANGSITISEKGAVRYRRSVGSAVFGGASKSPTDSGTRYKIGSVTKLFTAVLTMQLVEQASITLDGKLAEFFPELPNALDITYRDLLQHRSGLANYSEAAGFEEWRDQPKNRADLVAIINDGGVRFPPRERVEYNNSNYLLLSYVLEKVYKRPYAEIVRRQIADKIGLPRTYYGGLTHVTRHESVSYEFTPGGWVAQKETFPGTHNGAGGLVSNPDDLVRFIDALFAGQLVSQQSLGIMHGTNGVGSAGLWPYIVAGQTGYGHGGRIEGYRTGVYHFPDKRISIAYATNASVLSMDEIVDEVLLTLFERGHEPPTFSAVKLTPHQQAAYAGAWRSAAGMPPFTPFRQFTTPDQPIELTVRSAGDAPVASILGQDFPLVAFGEHEFMIREIGYFLRFQPRSDELVVRGPEWAYYLRREE
jgi:CubicO group peptidase (beta-lactamase class C family)